MSTVITISPVAGQPGIDVTGLDDPFLLDNDDFIINNSAWGGGKTDFQRLKTQHSEIVTPLGTTARTLSINGEYHAVDHVHDGVFRYPFARIERWRLSRFKLVLEWPEANKPWAMEVIHRPAAIESVVPGVSALPVVNIVGPETIQWYIEELTPTFEEYHASTPQVVQFVIKLVEAKDGL